MSKNLRPLYFFLLFIVFSVSAAAQSVSPGPLNPADRSSARQNKVGLSVTRDNNDVISISLTFVADGKSVKAETAEVTARFLSITKTTEGYLQFAAVGEANVLNMPAVAIDPASPDGVYARPTMTMQLASGAGGLWVTVRRGKDDSAKEVKLRVPPVGGTTTAEIRWKA